jgi:hypothetical protein
VWRAAAGLTLTVTNNSGNQVNVGVFNRSNLQGGQIADFVEVKPVVARQSTTFTLPAGEYGVVVRDAQNVVMYPGSAGLTPMSGTVRLNFNGTQITRQ